MPSASNDNIFQGIKGLVWGAFVGVVSFQVLAPNIWGYLHEALGLDYLTSYWLFTVIYFLIVPVNLFLWFWVNRKVFGKYLPPFGEHNSLKGKGKLFFWGQLIFLIIQIGLAAAGFLRHWAEWAIWAQAVFYAIWCFLLLLLCGSICRDRIKYTKEVVNGKATNKKPETIAVKIKTYFWELFSVLDKKKQEKTIVDKANDYFWQLFLVSAVAYLFLAFTAFYFLRNWIKTKENNQFVSRTKSSHDAGLRAFALQRMDSVVIAKVKDCQYLEDEYIVIHSQDSLQKMIADTANNNQTKKDTFSIAKEVAKTGSKPKKTVAAITVTNKADSINNKTDSININIVAYARHITRWEDSLTTKVLKKLKDTSQAVAVNEIDSFTTALNAITLTVRDSLSKTHIRNIDIIKNNLFSLAATLEKAAQSQLGLQLRSVQAKGMIMLISLFFILLTLYIFIRLIQQIQGLELEKMKNDKKVNPGLDEQSIIKQQECVDESSSVSAALWLFLSITAWLLIPIFKVVKDSDINVKDPYKSLTLSNEAGKLADAVNPRPKETDDNKHPKDPRTDTIWLKDPTIDTSLKTIKEDLHVVKQKVNYIEP